MTDIGTITSLLETAEDLSPSGFAIGFHVRLTSSELQFQTYPKDWIKTYSERGFILSDPSVSWAFTNTGGKRWSDLSAQDPENIFQQAAEYGMKFGISIGVASANSRSMAGFSRPDREFTDPEIAQLTQLVQDLHDLTDTATGMPEPMRAELHRLSVKMTHPS